MLKLNENYLCCLKLKKRGDNIDKIEGQLDYMDKKVIRKKHRATKAQTYDLMKLYNPRSNDLKHLNMKNKIISDLKD